MSAGYSGTPLARKLGIKEGCRVLLVAPPDGAAAALAPVPSGVRLEVRAEPEATAGTGGERFDVVLLFCPDRRALRERFRRSVSQIRWAGGLWVCWPKKSSSLHVDLVEGEVRALGLSTGLVDNKVCAFDADWSGLRFVVRKENRPKPLVDGGPSA